jgi:dynein heavy chain
MQVVIQSSEHPPIMKGTSWTIAAPFKETKFHRTPSESIANNYTPSASGLKLKDLPKVKGYKKSKTGNCNDSV